MSIIIYKMKLFEGKFQMVEIARYQNNEIKGTINEINVSEEDVLKRYNSGYYRTSEI